VIRAHRSDPLVHHRVSARFYVEYVRTRAALNAKAAALPVPTLVIQGGADPVASAPAAERWARAVPDGLATIRVYPGLLHEVLNEPEGPAILEEVAAWCERTVDGAAPAPRRPAPPDPAPPRSARP
jgi:lysophospholipase